MYDRLTVLQLTDGAALLVGIMFFEGAALVFYLLYTCKFMRSFFGERTPLDIEQDGSVLDGEIVGAISDKDS